MKKSMTLSLIMISAIALTACSSVPTSTQKEYQKRSAEASDQQLDREVEKLKTHP